MKILRIFLSIICLISIILGAIALKVFIIGDLMPVNRVQITDISANESNIKASGFFIHDSAKAFKSYKYRIDGDALYIKVYSVLVSFLYQYGTIEIDIEGDFTNINAIYIEDRDNQKLIWYYQLNNDNGLDDIKIGK